MAATIAIWNRNTQETIETQETNRHAIPDNERFLCYVLVVYCQPIFLFLFSIVWLAIQQTTNLLYELPSSCVCQAINESLVCLAICWAYLLCRLTKENTNDRPAIVIFFVFVYVGSNVMPSL